MEWDDQTVIRKKKPTSAEAKSKTVKIAGPTAIVEFANRITAEEAADKCIGLIQINGEPVKVAWAKMKPKLITSRAKSTVAKQSTEANQSAQTKPTQEPEAKRRQPAEKPAKTKRNK